MHLVVLLDPQSGSREEACQCSAHSLNITLLSEAQKREGLPLGWTGTDSRCFCRSESLRRQKGESLCKGELVGSDWML